jgi:hypothetical protein
MPAPRHYRAPREDGGTLVEPAIRQAPALLAENARLLNAARFDFAGRGLQELRSQARQELVAAAQDYTSQYRPTIARRAGGPDRPILLSGHQPELFHPGVWFKNFLLSRLAHEHHALGINFLVDHDTLGQPAIAVPTGSLTEPRLENVFFDEAAEERPFEERSVIDREVAEHFPERVWNALDALPWGAPRIVLDSLWPHVLNELDRHGNWGRAIAAGRHLVEADWGWETLELPGSRLWDSEPFVWFVGALLADLPRFAAAYNRALAEYRLANHLKSAQHPVPDLLRDGDWHETPFWFWSPEQPQRARLYVRHEGQSLAWKAGASQGRLSASHGAQLVNELQTLRARGGKIRPRALLTTLYARLFLGDLFIHGIGGAKYDEVTDALLTDFFGCPPPAYLTATATLRLPLPIPNVSESDLRQVRQQLRDLQWHGEWQAAAEQNALAARKRALLANIPERGQRRAWRHEMTEVNRTLADSLAQRRDELEQQFAQLSSDFRRARLLGSREFSFCLFPGETVRESFAGF